MQVGRQQHFKAAAAHGSSISRQQPKLTARHAECRATALALVLEGLPGCEVVVHDMTFLPRHPSCRHLPLPQSPSSFATVLLLMWPMTACAGDMSPPVLLQLLGVEVAAEDAKGT